MNEVVRDDEQIARFAVSSRQFGTNPLKAKWSLFSPPDDLRLSVFRTEGIEDHEIWSLGEQFVASPERNIRGRADLLVKAARDQGLEVLMVPDPHERHAELVGWPEDRLRQRPMSMRLAEAADFQIR